MMSVMSFVSSQFLSQEPHYHDGHIVFEVQPTVVQFTIYNDSLAIQVCCA